MKKQPYWHASPNPGDYCTLSRKVAAKIIREARANAAVYRQRDIHGRMNYVFNAERHVIGYVQMVSTTSLV